MRSMRSFHPMGRPPELWRVNLGTLCAHRATLPTDYGQGRSFVRRFGTVSIRVILMPVNSLYTHCGLELAARFVSARNTSRFFAAWARYGPSIRMHSVLKRMASE
jgi:hypothetical protein